MRYIPLCGISTATFVFGTVADKFLPYLQSTDIHNPHNNNPYMWTQFTLVELDGERQRVAHPFLCLRGCNSKVWVPRPFALCWRKGGGYDDRVPLVTANDDSCPVVGSACHALGIGIWRCTEVRRVLDPTRLTMLGRTVSYPTLSERRERMGPRLLL